MSEGEASEGRYRLPLTIANGAYRLVRRIGRGGMAAVYEAEVDLDWFDFPLVLARAELSRSGSRAALSESEPQPEAWSSGRSAELARRCETLGMPYPRRGKAAVKVLLDERAEVQERFTAEWLSMMGPASPNLVEVYGGGYDEALGAHYYAMELLPPLVSEAEIRRLPALELLELMRQSAIGLRALHQRGLIHRDVKPENLMCSRAADGRWQVKVGDLGIAKDTERSLALTGTQQWLGTPNFMAPELLGDSRQVGPAADVYGLGATLYTFLAGRAPYEGEGLYGLLHRMATGVPPTPLAVLARDAPPAVRQLVDEMMAADPEQRPASMDAVLARLEDTVAVLTGAAPPPPPPPGPALVERLTRATRRLLLVDPDPERRERLSKLFTQVEYQVTAVELATTALLRIGAGGCDLVVLADGLVDMPASAVLSACAGQQGSPPVVLISEQEEAGAAVWLRPDATLPALVAAVEGLWPDPS